MMNIRPYRIILFPVLVLLSSCDLLPNLINPETHEKGELFKIHDIRFSEDHSRINVSCVTLQDLEVDIGADSAVGNRWEVTALSYKGLPSIPCTQPTVTGVKWTGQENIKKADICMLAFVDLTRPESELVKAKNMLKRYKKTFGDNLFLTFMLPEGRISYTIPATDYALDMYVSHTALGNKMPIAQAMDGKSYLYSGLSELMERLADRQTHTYLDTAAHTAVAVFSSEDVYDNESNYPYDPNHFEIQDRLLNQLRNFPSDISIYFLDGYTASQEDGEEPEEERTSSILDVVCRSTGGQHLRDFGTVSFLRLALARYDVFVPDFEISLDNPEGNIYIGKIKRLKAECYSSGDSLLASATKEYSLGDVYNPVIVGEISSGRIWLRGTVRILTLLLLTYIILQLIVPAVRYKLFRMHHVVEYRNPNQTHNGISIQDTCYMCKGTFKPGDKVVAKCSHVVHEECWNENGQHCPEYGTGCQTGSHFYDRKHPYNLHNAPFYTEWVLLSIIVSWVAWSVYIFVPGTMEVHLVDSIVNYLVESIDTISMDSIAVLSARQYYITLFAFNVAFFSTLFGSILCVHRRNFIHFVLDIFVRAVSAGVVVFILFGVQCAGFVALRRFEPGFVSEMIPWALSVMVIEYISTFKTNFRPDHRKFLYSSVILSLFNALITTPCVTVDSIEQYVRLIFGYVVFFAGIAYVLARPDRKVRRPFLSVSGSFKETDIALYKWFLVNSNTVVTIGRSVDCSINLFPSLSGDVAPVHCSIRMVNGVHRLCVSDNDVVLNGRRARYHKEYTLYYGDVFSIGGVRFRYHGI